MISGNLLWSQAISKDMDYQSYGSRAYYTYNNLPENLYDILISTAERFPEQVSIVDNTNVSYTFSMLLSLVDQFSSYLTQERGVSRGDHVALIMYNSIEFCVAFLSLCKIGAVTVPLPSKYKEQEVLSLADKADLKYIICDENFQHYFKSYDSNAIIQSKNSESGYGFSHLLSSEYPACESMGRLTDPVIIMFTSGTTSQSKGVLIQNFNMLHAIISYQRILNISERDKSILATPIYHITGLVAILGLFLYTGGSLYLHRTFNANRVLTCVRDNKVTFLHASPTVFSLLIEEREAFQDLPSLRSFACGSSNMPIAKLKQLHEWLPDTSFHTVYGLTETTSPATIFPEDACTSTYIGSSGIPIPGVEIKIVAEDGSELQCRQVGEILLRGSTVITSYYKASTDAINSEGWLKTGDLGYLNQDNYLYIVDRKKDMINRGGEKIWSLDIENEINKIPGVLEVAVVGISDDRYGEVPAALVRLADDSPITEEELKAILKPRLANFQVPQKFVFTDTIPKTPNDKIDKKYIRQLLD